MHKWTWKNHQHDSISKSKGRSALCGECFRWSTWHSAVACVVPFLRSKFRVATSTSISGMSVVAVGSWLVLGHSDQQTWSSETNDARDGNIWRLPPRHQPRFQTTTYNSEPSKLPCWRCQLFVSCKVRKTCNSQTLKLQSEKHFSDFRTCSWSTAIMRIVPMPFFSFLKTRTTLRLEDAT